MKVWQIWQFQKLFTAYLCFILFLQKLNCGYTLVCSNSVPNFKATHFKKVVKRRKIEKKLRQTLTLTALGRLGRFIGIGGAPPWESLHSKICLIFVSEKIELTTTFSFFLLTTHLYVVLPRVLGHDTLPCVLMLHRNWKQLLKLCKMVLHSL